MLHQIVFATNNQHKIIEINKLLDGKLKLLSLSDINCLEELPETTNTIEGNALQKARYIYDKYGINCFADDTGLEVEFLNGKPGVDSAIYAGEQRNASANMDKLLSEMLDAKNRNAQFKTVIALVYNNKEHLFEGIIKGAILAKKVGKNGFGYDPVFMPEGYNVSFAEMTIEEKNKISHRALAVTKLVQFLKMNTI